VQATGVVTNIDAGAGADTLVGPNATNTWNITGANAGNIVGVVGSFVNVENLTGGTAADNFVFAAAGSVTGRIDGGTGTDTLDYSALGTAVHANLGISITALANLDGTQETPPTGSPATGTA